MSSFLFTEPKLFFTKNDSRDRRLGEVFRPAGFEQNLSHPQNSIALLGYPDDEGINLNGGRIGAAEAPTKIREFLFKMTPPLATEQSPKIFLDFGDLNPKNLTLEQRHEMVLSSVTSLYRKQFRVLSLGGGHDYGYPDAAAFLRHFIPEDVRPLVINFDAHLDVRPDDKGFNSGTPFYRLLNEFKGKFDFLEVGLQPQCNSPHHANWAKEMGAQLIELSEVERGGGLTSLLSDTHFSKITKKTPVFLSFDIDGLCSAEAPGCSQSWATGLKLSDYLKFQSQLSSLCDIRGLGVYEVSPPLDTAHITSKTAALICYNFLYQDQL